MEQNEASLRPLCCDADYNGTHNWHKYAYAGLQI